MNQLKPKFCFLSARLLTHAFAMPALTFLIICSSLPVRANTLKVPSQYATIAAAITAAKKGDTVLVADGTYTQAGFYNLDFGGKAITVTSVDGPTKTILQCPGHSGNNGRGFIFQSSETVSSVLSGFTIQGGYENADVGGGISIQNSSPTISNCAFSDSAYTGGGIYINNGAPTITNCSFNCSAVYGGGIYSKSTPNGSYITLTGCTFQKNVVNGYGGALDIDTNSSVNISNCQFIGNVADGSGGALDISSSTVNISSGCVFSGNNASGGGGAICANPYCGLTLSNATMSTNTANGGAGIYIDSYSTATVEACTFSQNNATYDGGGAFDVEGGSTLSVQGCSFTSNSAVNGYAASIYMNSCPSGTVQNCTFSTNSGPALGIESYSSADIEACLFIGNTAVASGTTPINGGAIYTDNGSSALIENSAFDGNSATGSGGAVWFDDTGTNTIFNCSFTLNSASNGNGGAIDLADGGTTEIVNSILWGDSASSHNEIAVDSNSTVVVTYSDVQGGATGHGNINANPQIVNAAQGNLDIPFKSPCTDAGTSIGAPTTDINGTTRPNPPSIGAYEPIYPPKVTSFSPKSGPYGTKVKLTGTNLTGVTAITFNGIAAKQFKVVSATSVTVEVPNGAKTGKISVTTPGGTASTSANFTVTTSPAVTVKTLAFNPSTITPGGQSTGTVTLSSVAPSGGALVTITQDGFEFTTVTVPAGKTSATFTVVASEYAPDGAYTFIADYNGGSADGVLTIQGG